jgi:hypothetical protein
VCREVTEPVHLLCPEGERFTNLVWSSPCLLNLKPDGQIPGEQPEADGNPIGMQPVADQMIEIMPIVLAL